VQRSRAEKNLQLAEQQSRKIVLQLQVIISDGSGGCYILRGSRWRWWRQCLPVSSSSGCRSESEKINS